MSNKIGVLKAVASTFGLIIEGDDGKWINADKTFKTQLETQKEYLNAMKGDHVEIVLNPQGYYTSIVDTDTGFVLKVEDGNHKIDKFSQKVADKITGKKAKVISPTLDVSPEEVEAYAKKTNEELKIKDPVKKNFGGVKLKNDVAKAQEDSYRSDKGYPPVKEEKVEVLPGAKQIYNTLKGVELELTKKANKFNYASWSDVWESIKEVYPLATYHVHENENGLPYFADDSGAMVKVTVKIEGLEHTIWHPILDGANKPMKKVLYTYKKKDWNTKQMVDVDVNPFTTFDINTAIQRGMVKACALFGLGLYVYQKEDLPKED